jgi:hypothetical protein
LPNRSRQKVYSVIGVSSKINPFTSDRAYAKSFRKRAISVPALSASDLNGNVRIICAALLAWEWPFRPNDKGESSC